MVNIHSESLGKTVGFVVTICLIIPCMIYNTMSGEFGSDTVWITVLWLLVVGYLAIIYLCLNTHPIEHIKNCCENS